MILKHSLLFALILGMIMPINLLAFDRISNGYNGSRQIAANTGTYNKIYQLKKGVNSSVNVKMYGAIGNGVVNDTKAIQKAIDNCPVNGTVIIDKNMVCNVNNLALKSDINFVCYGKLIQVTANNLQTFSYSLQNSSYSLLICYNVKNASIQIARGISNYEGILLLKSSNISIKNTLLNGNTSLSGFAGIMMYACDHVTVSNTEVLNFGQPRNKVAEMKFGSGIRALNINYLTILNSKIHNNGENGIFTNSCKYVKIDHNEINSNGMSGVQIAFGGNKDEYNYIISNNEINNNMADTIDVNNREFTTFDIKMVITGNTCTSNGFLGKLPTPDGSGIATLVNVSNVIVQNNKSSLCNRSSIYISGCGSITANNNTSDKFIEIDRTFDTVVLKNNIFKGSVNVLNTGIGKYLNIQNNTYSDISLPNGITVNKLLIQGNTLTACNINFNLTGSVSFVKNKTVNNTPSSNSIFYSSRFRWFINR
jgi:hypothetical protein